MLHDILVLVLIVLLFKNWPMRNRLDAVIYALVSVALVLYLLLYLLRIVDIPIPRTR